MKCLIENDWEKIPELLQDCARYHFDGDPPSYLFLGEYTGDLEGFEEHYKRQVPEAIKVVVARLKFLPAGLNYLITDDLFSFNMFTLLLAWYE